jgi:hypothetical protein
MIASRAMTSPLAAIHLLIGDQVGRYHFPDAGLGALAADVAVVLPGGGAVLRMLPHGSELPSSSRFTAGVRLDAIFGGAWRFTPGARDVMCMALGDMVVLLMRGKPTEGIRRTGAQEAFVPTNAMKRYS